MPQHDPWALPKRLTAGSVPSDCCASPRAGIIMMVNLAGVRMLGYEKGELEGKNVSCIM